MKEVLLVTMMLLIGSACAQYAATPRLWERIPTDGVGREILDFLASQGLRDCFKYVEDYRILLLRCLVDGRLVDAEIKIGNGHNYVVTYI